MILTMTACGNTAETNGSDAYAEEESVRGLAVKDLQYTESGTLDQFQISGTIESNVPLVKLSGHGKAVSDELGITVTDMSVPHSFDDGVTSVELSSVSAYMQECIGAIYNLFAGVSMDENEIAVEYIFACEDEAGNTTEFEIHYVVTGE